MNQAFRDGENQAYVDLITFLWDEGDLSSFDTAEDAIKGVLQDFLEPERVKEIVDEYLKPLAPPSEDGWYLVQLANNEERRLYYCRRYARGCDPWWKGFLRYGETPVKHEIGINDGEKVVGWSKVSSGDRVNLSQDVIDRLSTPYNLSAGWIKTSNIPPKDGLYLTLFWDKDYPDFNLCSYTKGKWFYHPDDEPTELVDYWRPLPHLPEDR